jgi:hypothetical protein
VRVTWAVGARLHVSRGAAERPVHRVSDPVRSGWEAPTARVLRAKKKRAHLKKKKLGEKSLAIFFGNLKDLCRSTLYFCIYL